MDAAKAVGATFTIQRFMPSTVTPPVNGTIVGLDALIDCGLGGILCTETYDYGTVGRPHRDPGDGLRPRHLDRRLHRHRDRAP